MKSVLLIIVVLLLVTHRPVSLFAQDLTPEGIWLHSNERIQVKIESCEHHLCGKIVWLKNPDDKEGVPIVDSENPDQAQRGQPLMGMRVLWGLVRSNPGLWTGGTIYNPDDGETYNARITMTGPDKLNVRVYVLLPLLGTTKIWTRVKK